MQRSLLIRSLARARGRSRLVSCTDYRFFSTEASEEEEKPAKQLVINKFGRLPNRDDWDVDEEKPPEFDQLASWDPSKVSRISQERVQVCNILTLQELVDLELPPSTVDPYLALKTYALQRTRRIKQMIKERVIALAEPQIPAIVQMEDPADKQDAMDELFENVEMALRDTEDILGKQPKLGEWVETALEQYLQDYKRHGGQPPKKEAAAEAVPMFMDVYQPDKDKVEAKKSEPHYDRDKLLYTAVPSILYPLAQQNDSSIGNLLEEWQLSAHDTSKRILLRNCTQRIAASMLEGRHVVVSGGQGVGKTSAVAACVAAARKAGGLVWYLPNCDSLSKNGYYIEPRNGLWDLPMLTQEVVKQFLHSHRDDVKGMNIPMSVLSEHLTDDQLKRQEWDGDTSVAAVLEASLERESIAAPCFLAATDYLMHHQSEKPFWFVLDQFSCFYKSGHYYHGEYDPEVKKAIPYPLITLFRPAMLQLGLHKDESSEEVKKFANKGSVIAATTESHAVPVEVTKRVLEGANLNDNIDHVVVPRLAKLEVEHVLANYETIGLGKLRLDMGATVLDQGEVEFLRMVSGGVPQKLMDACIM